MSLTTKTRSPEAVVKGRPVNWCTGFRPTKSALIVENDDGSKVPSVEFSYFHHVKISTSMQARCWRKCEQSFYFGNLCRSKPHQWLDGIRSITRNF